MKDKEVSVGIHPNNWPGNYRTNALEVKVTFSINGICFCHICCKHLRIRYMY